MWSLCCDDQSFRHLALELPDHPLPAPDVIEGDLGSVRKSPTAR
jgi:hypothetical protein